MKRATYGKRDKRIFKKGANRTNAKNVYGFGEVRGMNKL